MIGLNGVLIRNEEYESLGRSLELVRCASGERQVVALSELSQGFITERVLIGAKAKCQY